MTGTLVQFGVIMLVVMIGFAMSFHVLFQDFDSFGETLLDLFQAMLGDTAFFEVFSGLQYDSMATALLVMYLFIVTIMLLNLLVAILSTSHSRVEVNVEREFKVSKARIIEHYQLVVKDNLLPAPFNVVDDVLHIVGLALGTKIQIMTSFRGLLGRLLFFCVLSPIALAGGMLLCVFGFISAPVKWYMHYCEVCKKYKQDQRNKPGSRTGSDIATAPACSRVSDISEKKTKEIIFQDKDKRTTIKEGEKAGETGVDRKTATAPTMPVYRQVLMCVTVAICCPLVCGVLVALWFYGMVQLCCSRISQSHELDGDVESSFSESGTPVEDMLKENSVHGGVGVDDLRRFLDNPMDDSRVRQDEKTRATTVEHMKLLRDRLERCLTRSSRFEELRNVAVATRERLRRLETRSDDNRRMLTSILHILETRRSESGGRGLPPSQADAKQEAPSL